MGFLKTDRPSFYLEVTNQPKLVRPLFQEAEGMWVHQIPSVSIRQPSGQKDSVRRFRQVDGDFTAWMKNNPDPLWESLDDSVAGNSGDMSGTEITWEEITEHAKSSEPIVEITTATKRKRRVFTFCENDFRKAININRPTNLMLSFVDYLHVDDFGVNTWEGLTQETKDWITTLETKMAVYFKYLSTGPDTSHTIIRKTPAELLAQIQAG